MSVAGALATTALFLLVSYVPGWAVARIGVGRADVFTRLWIGLSLTSVVGLVLADRGRFSLTALLSVLAIVAVPAFVFGRRGARAGRGTAESPGPEARAARSVALIAGAAALATVLWSWPPYETVIAAADSTMYVNAGVHLARTGSLAFRETLAALLPIDAAGSLFQSVGWNDTGPFIRLPGGLLMSTRAGGTVSPAFFPLLPVWTAILGAVGGASTAVLVAPFFSALAVGGAVLFAGETLGSGVAAVMAVTMIANFALWWYAKFAMPEPLAAAAIWGGLLFLHRAGNARDWRLALLAGAVLGLAGLARTETFLFLLAAGVLAFAWGNLRAPLVPLLSGFGLMLGVAVLVGTHLPSHHLAFLRNDLILQYYVAIAPWVAAARQNGRLAMLGVALLVLLAAAGVLGRRGTAGFARGVLRLVGPVAIVAALLVYVRIGGVVSPRRDLSWLAVYCSWPLLALALVGAPLAWRRGGEALRFAAYAWIVATAIFVLNPRISAYQPWAIRRFLPLVIPGIALAGATAITWIDERPHRGGRLLAVGLLAVVAVSEVLPVLRVRTRPYYAGNFALVSDLAGRFPADSIVAIEGGIADLQFQVPLWLMTGRETIMLYEGGQRWQSVMHALAASGRPVFWIGDALGAPRQLGDIRLRQLGPDLEVRLAVPDGPGDTTPSLTVTRFVLLRIYGVAVGDGSDVS